MTPFWADPDAERRFLAEHGAVGHMDGDEHVIEAGNADLLPPWPPGDYVETDVVLPLHPLNRTHHVGRVVQRPPEVARSAGDRTEQNKYPPWPEVLLAPSPLRIEPVTLCAVCQTPVEKHGDAGWRHELGLAARGGCNTPWPAG